jgi:hypothetical protein
MTKTINLVFKDAEGVCCSPSHQRNVHNYGMWDRTQRKNGDTFLINGQIRRL